MQHGGPWSLGGTWSSLVTGSKNTPYIIGMVCKVRPKKCGMHAQLGYGRSSR